MDNLRGVYDPDLDKRLGPALLEYLRHVATEGVPARSTGERGRVEAQPHQSARSAMDQLFKQIWKEVRKGRVLIAPKKGIVERLPVTSSSFGAVDKQNPDRSIAAEKRIVHDQRPVNSHVAPEAHPPAYQPRHHQLAKLILYWKGR